MSAKLQKISAGIRAGIWIFVAALTFLVPLAASSEPLRPIVLIPGVLGTRLIDSSNGDLLWGSAASLRRLDRLVLSNGPRDPSPDDGVVVDGTIQEVSIFGVWKTQQYSTLRNHLAALGYTYQEDFFEFPYDWRQSNFTSAKRLVEFVDSTPALKDRDFDIVAHSMGGLVADIYIKREDAKRQVRRVIFMGTPFKGSTDTLATLTDGWGSVQNWMAGGLNTVRRFALSMPSFYELLPTYTNCCRLGEPGQSTNYDLLTFNGWKKVAWLPDPLNDEPVDQAIRRARELRRLSEEPFPANVTPFFVAGSGFTTRWQSYIQEGAESVSAFSSGAGDGTVAEISATNQNSQLAFVSLAQHSTLFNDDAARTTLTRILTGVRTPEDRNSVALSAASPSDVVELHRIGIVAESSILEEGQSTVVTVELTAKASGAAVETVPVSLELSDPQGRTIPLEAIQEVDASAPRPVVRYRSTIGPFESAGAVEVRAAISGLRATIRDYVVIIEGPR